MLILKMGEVSVEFDSALAAAKAVLNSESEADYDLYFEDGTPWENLEAFKGPDLPGFDNFAEYVDFVEDSGLHWA